MVWLLALFTHAARAEYRAFELVIANATTGQERVIVSNLDPRQYRHYYYVRPDESVSYRQTWMCRGNTSRLPVCPKPALPESPKRAQSGPAAPVAK